MENNSSAPSPSAQPTSYYVGMHTNARRGPYYFDVAKDTHILQENLKKIMRTFRHDKQLKLEDCYVLVWYEECESEAAAWARVAEIRALPRAWQRGLIQSMNPQWANLNEIDIGFPGACVLPEIAGMPFGIYRET